MKKYRYFLFDKYTSDPDIKRYQCYPTTKNKHLDIHLGKNKFYENTSSFLIEEVEHWIKTGVCFEFDEDTFLLYLITKNKAVIARPDEK